MKFSIRRSLDPVYFEDDKISLRRKDFDSESFASNDSTLGVPKPCCSLIIFHEGRFKVLWDWIILILVLFTAIQIPYYAAFETHSGMILDLIYADAVPPVVILSLCVDIMFVLDIVINFRTTYVRSSSDEIVRNSRLLAIHYIKTWFFIDILAVIPFDWILYSKGRSDNTSTLIGLLKSARLLRLFRIARRIDRYSEYGLAVLFLLLSLFTLIAHWFACVWNAIGHNEENNPASWIRRMDEELNGDYNGTIRMTTSQRYACSLYFIVSTLTSVGFGNVAATTQAEQIFSVITMLLGALMYATIFGNMVAIVQRLYSKTSSLHTQMNTVGEFMKFYKIPKELRTSINNYVRREWNTSNCIDIETVLQRFPDCIQADLTYELYQNIFNSVEPLRSASISCMRALAMKFKTITLQVNNYALRQGEEINSLYILGKGSLEIIIDGEIKTILSKYALFGYDFLNLPRFPKSKANIRASNLVEIYYIHKDDMTAILKMYPKFAERFCSTMKFGYDLNDEHEEGICHIRSRKHKMHVASVAKNALAMPLMGRLRKSILRRANTVKSHGDSEKNTNQNGSTVVNISLNNTLSANNDYNVTNTRPTTYLQQTGNEYNEHTSPLDHQQPIASTSNVRFTMNTFEENSKQKLHYSNTSTLNETINSAHDFEKPKTHSVLDDENRLQIIEENIKYIKEDVDTKLNNILSILSILRKRRPSSTSSEYEHVTGENIHDFLEDTTL